MITYCALDVPLQHLQYLVTTAHSTQMSAYNILHITTCCIGEYLLLPLTVPVMSTHMLARTHLHHVEYTVPTNEHMY